MMPTKSIDELRNESQPDSNALDDYGNYNPNHELSQEQIELAARLEIDPQTENEKYYINGFSLRDYDNNSLDIQSIFNTADLALLDAAFNLTESINTAKAGKPAFFVIEDKKHYVTVALVPNKDAPPKLSIQYFNSIVQPDPQLTNDLVELQSELENDIGPENTIAIKTRIASIEKAISDQTTMANVGKNFTTALLEHLKNNNISLSSETFLDRSVDQQLGNCCGLSVAANIAAVVNGNEIFSPKSVEEKKAFYGNMGNKVFQYIKTGFLPEASVIEKKDVRIIPEITETETEAHTNIDPEITETETHSNIDPEQKIIKQNFLQKISSIATDLIKQIKQYFGLSSETNTLPKPLVEPDNKKPDTKGKPLGQPSKSFVKKIESENTNKNTSKRSNGRT